MILDVKVEQVSEDKVGFRSRVVSIKVKGESGKIYTPSRVVTNYEIAKKRCLPTQIRINNEIVFHSEPVCSPNFVKDNKSIYKKINNFETLYGDLVKIHKLIIPCIWAKKSLLEDSRFAQELVNVIVTMFTEAGAEFEYSVVGIPPLYGLSFSQYKETLRNIINKFEKLDVQPFPILSLDYHFDKLVKFCVDELNLNFIGFKFGVVKRYIPQYLFMKNILADKDIAFVSVNTKRNVGLGLPVKDFAIMHLLPFTCADLYVSEIGPFCGGGGEDVHLKFRLLDRINTTLPLIENLSQDKINDLIQDFLDQMKIRDTELEKIVNVLKDKNKFSTVREDILKGLKSDCKNERKKAQERKERLISFTRVHELILSSCEFIELQKFIEEDNVDDYLKTRPNIRKVGNIWFNVGTLY